MTTRQSVGRPRARLSVAALLEDRTVPCGAECLMMDTSDAATVAALVAEAEVAPAAVEAAAPAVVTAPVAPAVASVAVASFLFPTDVVTRPEDGAVEFVAPPARRPADAPAPAEPVIDTDGEFLGGVGLA